MKIAILGDFNLLNECDLSRLNINSIQINNLTQIFNPTYYMTIKYDLFKFNKKYLNTNLTTSLISPLIKKQNKIIKRLQIIDINLIKKSANINIVAIYQAIALGYKQIFLFGIKANKADKDWINIIKFANKKEIEIYNCGKYFNITGIKTIDYEYEENNIIENNIIENDLLIESKNSPKIENINI